MDDQTERLLRIAERQAEATGSMAEVQRSNLATIRTIEENMTESTMALKGINEQLGKMEQARNNPVEDIQQSITTAFKAGDSWWRKALIIITIAIVASQLLGVAIGDTLLKLLKP